jgi:hypothetical protein
MDFREMRCEDGKYMELAHEHISQLSCVSMVFNIPVLLTLIILAVISYLKDRTERKFQRIILGLRDF